MKPILCCHCHQQNHPVRRIVLTGGPGAGKTAVLEMARKYFCDHVAILPEAASIIFSGGFLRKDTLTGKKAAQRAIYHIQREQEQMLEDEGTSSLTLCDRGTLDGLAYWPNSEASFFEALGTTKQKEMARYHCVIHLRTPHLSNGYNHKNPIRIESPEEAAKIDDKIAEAWAAHPRVKFIDSSEFFFDKVAKALTMIIEELPECCQPK
jgi:predicted ATPase